jgi:hypothetical protein
VPFLLFPFLFFSRAIVYRLAQSEERRKGAAST